MLVDALIAQQQSGIVREEDPQQLARFIWAIVHGIARLAIDGQLHGSLAETERLSRYAMDRVRAGIARTPVVS